MTSEGHKDRPWQADHELRAAPSRPRMGQWAGYGGRGATPRQGSGTVTGTVLPSAGVGGLLGVAGVPLPGRLWRRETASLGRVQGAQT